MKRAFSRTMLLMAVATILGGHVRAAPFALTDDFVRYMKAVLNPFEFGRRADGRYYPYSTRYGRRVGFGSPVADKMAYQRGVSAAEADEQLRMGLAATQRELAAWLASRRPALAFDALDAVQREILLDRAFTEGIPALPSEFVAAVLKRDWHALLATCLYVRAPDGWPDYVKNHAFAHRWIYGPRALAGK